MKWLSLIVFTFLLSSIACKKTVDSESNRWNRNQARLERLMSEYPNFKTALEAQLIEARQVYSQVTQQPDEETKLEWLTKANRTASPSFVNKLDNVDKEIEQLRESAVKLFEHTDSDNSLLVAGIKNLNVDATIKEAKDYLVSIDVSDKYQAEQVVVKAMNKIERLNKSIEKSLKEIEKTKQEATQ